MIVLGCTHYPFLRKQIEKIVCEQIESSAGDQIAVIDTGPAVAKELQRRLEQSELLCKQARSKWLVEEKDAEQNLQCWGDILQDADQRERDALRGGGK